jgi:hypothetical protein
MPKNNLIHIEILRNYVNPRGVNTDNRNVFF